MVDDATGRTVTYASMSEAKQACETMGSVCLGAFSWFDGLRTRSSDVFGPF